MNAMPALPILTAQATQPAGGGGMFDWFTLAAQVINFLLLVFLLWFFLFRRVTAAMDRREKKIASHFQEAERAEKEAREKADDLQDQRETLEKQRKKLLDDAKADAETQRKKLAAEAREQVQEDADRWHDDLQREKQSFLQRIGQMAGRQACDIARRALRDLADEQLEGRMIDVLIARLVDLPEEDRKMLAEAMGESARPLIVATAWETASAERSKLTQAIHKHLAQGEVNYETDPQLACGIELRAAGHQVGWTLDGYVRGIRDALAAAVDEQIAAAMPAAEPADEQEKEDQTEDDPRKKDKAPQRGKPTSKDDDV